MSDRNLAIVLLAVGVVLLALALLLNGCSFRMIPGPAGIPQIDLRVTGLQFQSTNAAQHQPPAP